MPEIAVVILNWNGKHYLEKFLQKLVDKTSGNNIHFYLVDNGSIDDSINFIENNFPFFKIIKFHENLGYAGGYAKALKEIKADYFVIINNDIEVTDNWLSPIVNLMESDQSIAACMPKILSFNQKEYFEYSGAAGGFIDFFGYPFCRGRILNTIEKDYGQYDKIIDVFWATGACMIIRSKAYFEAGGFDSIFFAHMEEIDLCWRLWTLGYKVICYPKSKVYHVGGGTLPVSPFKIYLNYRNSLFLLIKNLPKKFYFIIVIRLFLDIISSLIYLIKGNFNFFLSVLKAHKDFFNLLGQIFSERKNFYNKKNIKPQLPEIVYNRSILIEYFLFNRKKFYLLNEKFHNKVNRL